MTGRVEAFSDGVFAIAITLPILDIRPPQSDADPPALVKRSGTIAAFIVSVVVIGGHWLQHHRLFRAIARTAGWLLLLNLVFLMTISFLSFPTALVAADRLASGHQTNLAVAVYGFGLLLPATTMSILVSYIVPAGRLASSVDVAT